MHCSLFQKVRDGKTGEKQQCDFSGVSDEPSYCWYAETGLAGNEVFFKTSTGGYRRDDSLFSSSGLC